MSDQPTANKTRSTSEGFVIEATGEQQVKSNHVLAIAVDHYEDKKIDHLSNCVKDVEALLEVLTQDYFFDHGNIRFLRNRMPVSDENIIKARAEKEKDFAFVGAADHESIIAQLKYFAQTMTPEDNLIICYSGHGIYDKDFNEGYWIPSDGKLKNNATYIENGTIRTALNAINCHHTVLISDSCYSGTLFSTGQRRALDMPRVYKYASRWGLTAGRRNETVSDGDQGGNSPFAEELIRILKRKQEIWIGDLCKEIVTEITEKGEAQTPMGEPFIGMTGHDNGQFVFLPRMATEKDYWITAWRENIRKGYYAFLARYPNGEYEEAALEALNVFATGEKPEFSEAALATYLFLFEQLPSQAKNYTISFLKRETRSVFSKTALVMYADLAVCLPEQITPALNAFVLLGENAANMEALEKEYTELKGKEKELKAFFNQHFNKKTDTNPYRGFAAYREEDSELFFGRKAVIQTLADKLEKTKILVVSAPAYTGKTSVILAGLYPLLKKRDKYELLEIKLDSFRSSTHHYSNVSRNINPEKKQILFIDNYEQLWGEEFHEEKRKSNERELTHLLQEKQYGSLKIILCLKSNFEKQLQLSSFGAAFWNDEQRDDFLYRLPNLNAKELRELMLGPMWSRSYAYETEELIDNILREVQNTPNGLALLSFVLHRLGSKMINEKTKTVTSTAYKALGKVRGVLDKMADEELYNHLSPDQQHVLQRIFLRMTTPLGDGNYISRKVELEEWVYPDKVKSKLVKEVINGTFAEKRELFAIKTHKTEKYGEVIVGIQPKDLLINSWSRCRQWIEEFGAENFQLQRDLATATTRITWDRRRRQRSERLIYWDNDARLAKVLAYILEVGHTAVNAKGNHSVNELVQKIEEELPENDRTGFTKLLVRWKRGDNISLDDFIMTGASTDFLSALLNATPHWLSSSEAEFVKESWDKKVQAFMSLKKERDEALVAKRQTEELLHKSAIQTMAFKAKYQKQTQKDLLFMQKGFKPDLHLILVGIDDYPLEHWKLMGCVADVQAIAAAFASQEGKLYNKVHPYLLTDKEATKAAILKLVEEVKSKAGALDFVFVYLTGKSMKLENEDCAFIANQEEYKTDNFNIETYYSSNKELTNEERINPAVLLSGKELCTALMLFKCKVVLILDIPYGGEFLSTLIKANHSDNPDSLSHYVFALSASSYGEMSYEKIIDGKPRGVFSHALTNSITTTAADLDNNGVIYLDELLRYISEMVRKQNLEQNVLAVTPPVMTNIPLFQLGDTFNLPEVEILLSGHITDDAVIESINLLYGENKSIGATR